MFSRVFFSFHSIQGDYLLLSCSLSLFLCLFAFSFLVFFCCCILVVQMWTKLDIDDDDFSSCCAKVFSIQQLGMPTNVNEQLEPTFAKILIDLAKEELNELRENHDIKLIYDVCRWLDCLLALMAYVYLKCQLINCIFISHSHVHKFQLNTSKCEPNDFQLISFSIPELFKKCRLCYKFDGININFIYYNFFVMRKTTMSTIL